MDFLLFLAKLTSVTDKKTIKTASFNQILRQTLEKNTHAE